MVCSPAKRNDIQLLRGVSVLLVLLFHLEMQGFENGYLGVDIFFVLSGFLMGLLYNRYSPIEFYRRRIERIAPAYFAVILISCSFCFFLANLSDFSQFFEQALANSIFLGNVYFWSNASYFNKQYFYPLLHLWSLSIEVQFYILVPILFPVFAKYRYVLLLFALCSAMLALIVVSFSPKTAFFLLPFRLWEFLLGAFVGLASLQQSTKNKQNLITDRLSLSLLFLVVLLIASLDIRPAANSFLLGHPSLLTMIIPVLVSLILFLGVSEKCIANNIVFSTLSRLGDASYSLYLVHFPIIVFFNYEPFGGTILKTDSITALLIQIVIIGAATLICYLVFEKNRSVKIASLLLPVGFICVSALFLFLAKAMKFEITEPNQRVVASAWLDRGTYRCGKISRLINLGSEVCRIGQKAGDKNLLLIGNSHADAIKLSFAKVANEHGYNLWLPVHNMAALDDRLTFSELLQDMEDFEPDQVVIHVSSWTYEDPKYIRKILTIIASAAKKNIPVTFLEPTPYYDFDVPKFLSNDNRDKQNLFYEGMSEQQYKTQTAAYRSFINQNFSGYISEISIKEQLCPLGKCMIAGENNAPLYFDSNHLTLTGASYLEPSISKWFKSSSGSPADQ